MFADVGDNLSIQEKDASKNALKRIHAVLEDLERFPLPEFKRFILVSLRKVVRECRRDNGSAIHTFCTFFSSLLQVCVRLLRLQRMQRPDLLELLEILGADGSAGSESTAVLATMRLPEQVQLDVLQLLSLLTDASVVVRVNCYFR